MGGGRKRKTGGGGEGLANRRKRGAAAATIPIREEESPSNSEMDEPQIAKIIFKEEPEPETDPTEDNDQQELFEDPSNQDLAPAQPDIDISDVILTRPPKHEPIVDDEDHDQMDSNTITETQTLNIIVIEVNNGGNCHASAPSTAKPLERMVRQTECENGTGVTVTTGNENNETTSNSSADTTGNPLTNEMTGEREGTARTVDEDDTTTTTIGSQCRTEGIFAKAGAQDTATPSIDPDIERHVDGAPSTSNSSEGRAGQTECENGAAPNGGEENSGRNSSAGMGGENIDEDTTASTIGSQRLIEGTSATEGAQEKMLPQSGDVNDKVWKNLTGVSEKNVEKLSKSNMQKTNVITRLTAELKAATDHIELQQRKVDSEKFRNDELSNQIIPRLTSENKRLQDDNAGLRRQEEEANSRIDLLKNSLSEKENELARFKARYFRDQEGNFQLHLEVKKGDEQSVKQLIHLGADVNAKNYINGQTAIITAVTSEANEDVNITIVKYLIEQGAYVFALDDDGETFLHKLAKRDSASTPAQFHDISNYLVSKNLARLFKIKNKEYSSPLMLAASYANLLPDTVLLLRQHKSDKSFTTLASILLRCAVDVHSIFLSSATIETKTADAADEKLVKLLVSLGANVNRKNDIDTIMTPLHIAAKSTNMTFAINIIKFLIDSGANVNAKFNGRTFLHEFLRHCHIMSPKQFHDLVAFLVLKGLARLFNAREGNNSTPFLKAGAYVKIESETLILLKENHVDFHAVDGNGNSVLYYATWGHRSIQMISDLLDHGVDPERLNYKNESMLHQVVKYGNVELLEFFFSRGLDVNAQDEDGCTPLRHALQRNENATDVHILNTVQFLLRNGAKSDMVDNKGKSPLDYFNENRDKFTDADEIFTCFSLGPSC